LWISRHKKVSQLSDKAWRQLFLGSLDGKMFKMLEECSPEREKIVSQLRFRFSKGRWEA